MPYEIDDDVIRHLKRQERPLTAWLFGSIQLDQTYFEYRPAFFMALQRIESVETITHFNHDDLDLVIEAEDSDEITDTNSRLTIQYRRKFKRVCASNPFVVISGESGFLILTPVRYWSCLDEKYSTGHMSEIGLERFSYEHKLTSPRPADEILEETWKYATKTGDRDMRYKDNISVSLVQGYGVALLFQNQANWELGGLRKDEQDQLYRAIQEIISQEIVDENHVEGGLSREDDEVLEDDHPSGGDDDSEDIWCKAFDVSPGSTLEEIEAAYRDKMKRLYLAREEGLDWARQNDAANRWHEILSVSPDTKTADEINAAYKEKIKQYHPDRVASLGDKLRLVAEVETKKLNAARERGLELVQGSEDSIDSEIGEDIVSDEAQEEDEYQEEYDEAWYDILAIEPDATSEAVESAYYKTMEYYQNALRIAEMSEKFSP